MAISDFRLPPAPLSRVHFDLFSFYFFRPLGRGINHPISRNPRAGLSALAELSRGEEGGGNANPGEDIFLAMAVPRLIEFLLASRDQNFFATFPRSRSTAGVSSPFPPRPLATGGPAALPEKTFVKKKRKKKCSGKLRSENRGASTREANERIRRRCR